MPNSINELPQAVRNVRYLLRRAGLPPEHWAKHLAASATFEEREASEIIHGRKPTRVEAERIAACFNTDTDQLLSSPLYGLGEQTIIQENLRFLLENLKEHTQKKLAKDLDVDEASVSRWGNTKRSPHPKNLRQLLKCFGLPADIDLKSEPLFLSTTPVGAFAQKAWIIDYIEKLPPEEIAPVFVAIRRILLGKDEKN